MQAREWWTVRGDAGRVVDDLRRWLDAPATEDDDPPRLVVETSGSTGAPKRVVLGRNAVLASVRASAARLAQVRGAEASGPWVLALPPTFVAGLQVLARSLAAGHEPVLLERDGWPDGDGWSISLVPTQLRRLLEDPTATAALRRAHTVLLGGGPTGDLRERAAAAGVHVVATYGSAETAGGCVYDGLPLDGVAVALGEGGRIRIGGPTLFDGYAGDPEQTAAVLRDGWFHTSDAGTIDADGRLCVIGRVDDVIVSGGLNVPGPAVAARLQAHPDVAAAEVVGVDDAEWGRAVVAVVEPRAERPAPSLAELRDWVAGELPRAWAPRRVVHVDRVPLMAQGKPDRRALRRLAEEAHGRDRTSEGDGR
ncbi:AMP-binding protein [Nocardioides sp.]|uniref:AMP-binding protein n=1 Tax=Nocardioides sp. TaxID=35761 RepID=UPI003511D0B8